MKLKLTLIPVAAVLMFLTAANAQGAKPAQYTLTDLGAMAQSPFSQATYINPNGIISGLAVGNDGAQHAILWSNGSAVDISTPGFGGPNSGAFGVNAKGQVSGLAETSTIDPNGENFCAYFTGYTCLPFEWQNGTMTPLPLLGGNNGSVSIINSRGEIAGTAETGTVDLQCPTIPGVNGVGPLVLDYVPVVWGPKPGTVRQLSLLPGDTVGMALWINDKGQASGYSGTCDSTALPPFAGGKHAVLWDVDGTPHDLGSLGGTFNPNALGAGNVAFEINNQGEIAGVGTLPGSATFHAFVWTNKTGMQDLGTLPGEVDSAALGMNNTGDIVGASIDGTLETGFPSAVLWHNGGTPLDLNTTIPADSSLHLITAFMVNDYGQIVGFGMDMNTFEIHAYLLTPTHGNGPAPAAKTGAKPAVTESTRRLAIHAMGLGRGQRH